MSVHNDTVLLVLGIQGEAWSWTAALTFSPVKSRLQLLWAFSSRDGHQPIPGKT